LSCFYKDRIACTGTALPPLINYDSPGNIRAFLNERGLGTRKKFGQNFLINPSARSRLLDALDFCPGALVWEIGPGLGAMTEGLLERGWRVTAFEIDPAFSRILRELFAAHQDFNLIEGDVLKTWPITNASSLFSTEELFLLGNLPYNIAATLLADFIEKNRFFKRMVITVQSEVAQRMCAKPGSGDYSSFSVLCSSVYKVFPLQLIKNSSFYPVPRVDSKALRLELLSPIKKWPPLFYPLVRGLFSSRRKTIKNTLSAFAFSLIMGSDISARKPVPCSRDLAEEVLFQAGISGDRRAETLEINEFAALAVFLEEFLFYGK
jgi:16S rRNA (adenine1518-N6/adenine1519-N6)-dimethyltransferase